MPDETIKRRTADAKKAAKAKFKDMKFDIINSDNHIFCFVASKSGIYETKVRVVVDEIKKEDIEIIKSIKILPNQTKEIWCRPYGSRGWKIMEFDHLNNLVNS